MSKVAGDSTFLSYARDALAHIHDRPYLQTHPLVSLLPEPHRPSSAEFLHRVLAETIDQLHPLGNVPSYSTEWRRYRYLFLRYLEGTSPEEIANDLALSERQARRLHHEALGAFAALLQQRLCKSGPVSSPTASLFGSTVAMRQEVKDLGADDPDEEGEFVSIDVGHNGARIDLGETLATVLQTIAPLIAQQNGRVTFSLSPDLPHVALERAMLRQVFLLFLTYELQAELDRLVRISADVFDAEKIRVTIVSEGQTGTRSLTSGLRTTDSEIEALLKTGVQIVQMHGGTVERLVEVNSTHTYQITIPAIPPTTILVVDDNPGIPRLFRRYLQGTGYRILEAGTAQGAIDLIAQFRPNVIVLDVILPTQDGWEILHHLHSHSSTRQIPTIVCSVLPERALASALGVTDFLPKPVTRQSLLATLERCLPGD